MSSKYSLVVERKQGDGLHAREGCENRPGSANVNEQKSDQSFDDGWPSKQG